MEDIYRTKRGSEKMIDYYKSLTFIYEKTCIYIMLFILIKKKNYAIHMSHHVYGQDARKLHT